jgi:hypothetical protein
VVLVGERAAATDGDQSAIAYGREDRHASILPGQLLGSYPQPPDWGADLSTDRDFALPMLELEFDN